MTSRYEYYDVRIELIKRSKSQERIIEVARNDPNWHVRQFAVTYIDDEDVLKEILVSDPITSVSITAMERIGDVDFLVDACMNNPFSHIRLATLNRIIDESLLLGDSLAKLLDEVALSDPNDFIVKLAIESNDFTSQEVLISIAKSQRDEEIRRIAVSNLADEEVLADFALNDSSVFIRREAILNPNLSNPDVLSEAVRNDGNEFNRYWACQKIDDREYLLKLIFDKSFYHRLDDLSLNSALDCQDYFKQVYNRSDDEYRRIVSINFIWDKLFLNDIVLNGPSDRIRLEAMKNKRFSNQGILKGLISNEDNPEILFLAISKVKDEDILTDYVKEHMNDDKVTLKAISKINNFEFLRELSKHPNPEIRLHAVRSFSNDFRDDYNSVLRQIALTDENCEVCLEAAKIITDSYDLIDIASKSQDKKTRITALARIPASRLLDKFLFVHRPIMESLEDTKLRVGLRHLALDEMDDDIRRLAISRLDDKKIIDHIISLENDDSSIAQKRLDTLFEDIKRIDNELSLKDLISSDDSDVSYVAQKTLDDLASSQRHINRISEITDVDELKRIINEDFNYYVRCEAEGKLENILFNIRLDEIGKKENQDKLKNIVRDETFPLEVRNKAFSKITDSKFKEDYYAEGNR